MFQIKKVMAGSKRVAVGVVVAVASVGAFAQSSGGTTGSSFDVTPIVNSINAVVPTIVAVGGAVLGAVAVAWGIKMVRTFLGR
ncbi:major capsid protein [Burkholderia dolosa]|jgi:hypothetical protein|uniref:major capsid protein n=1 Tax=Burkholderia dolosa TaxID=152500 RepID=UPI00264DF802|nr:major capsid protein [Burkholderia dolosa]MDN7423765.1 major capsid protein [Burkholderia dolosa]